MKKVMIALCLFSMFFSEHIECGRKQQQRIERMRLELAATQRAVAKERAKLTVVEKAIEEELKSISMHIIEAAFEPAQIARAKEDFVFDSIKPKDLSSGIKKGFEFFVEALIAIDISKRQAEAPHGTCVKPRTASEIIDELDL